jgi:predicted GIY-YIG superfamily endonuclease
MAKQKDLIVKEIEDFKNEQGGNYDEYYIGITKDIDRRIVENNTKINEHIRSGIYEKDIPIYSAEAATREIAVEVELYFQDKGKGMQGYNPGAKGVASTKTIYCFKSKIKKINETKIITKFKDFKLMKD